MSILFVIKITSAGRCHMSLPLTPTSLNGVNCNSNYCFLYSGICELNTERGTCVN